MGDGKAFERLHCVNVRRLLVMDEICENKLKPSTSLLTKSSPPWLSYFITSNNLETRYGVVINNETYSQEVILNA